MLLALRSLWESASNPVTITPATASLTLATFAPSVQTPRVITPTKATLVLSTFAPTITTPRLVTPAVRALTLSSFAPSVTTSRVMTPGASALTLATFAPTVTATANVTVTPPTASLALATFAPVVTGDVVIVSVAPEVPTPPTGEFGHVVSDTGRRLRFPQAPEFQPVVVEPGTGRLALKTFAPLLAAAEAPVDITEAFIALYASGAISDLELAALIAA